MLQNTDWSEADAVLDEAIVLTPDGYRPYPVYRGYMQSHGYPTITEGAIRRRLQRRGLDDEVSRIQLASSLSSNLRADYEKTTDNKAYGHLDWRELAHHLARGKELQKSASNAQDHAYIAFPQIKDRLNIILLADWHLASLGVNHLEAEELTDRIMSHDNLMIGLLGDMTEMAIRQRSVKECMNQQLDPTMQRKFMERWLAHISSRVLFATWDNHWTDREQELSGLNSTEAMYGQRLIYFDGLGNLDIQVGQETYSLCVSHKFKTRSRSNALMGQVNYMRYEAQDREIAIGADSHVPGIYKYREGGTWRMAVNTGTLNTDHDWVKRNFTLSTSNDMPVIELYAEDHYFHAYENIGLWEGRYATA